MEERPKTSHDSLPNDDEADQKGQDDRANPGEIFLKKWMGLSEKREPQKTKRTEENSRFAGFLHNSVLPRLISKETLNERRDGGEVVYERTRSDGAPPKREDLTEAETEGPEQTAEESTFDTRHERKEAAEPDGSGDDSNVSEDESQNGDESSNIHHISSVIGERAKEMHKETAAGHTRQTQRESKVKTQSTISHYRQPIVYGFIAALFVLLVSAAIYIAG